MDKLGQREFTTKLLRAGGSAMNKDSIPPIRRQAADALRRARKLPIGHDRNDLRQLALGLLWLEKRGYLAVPEDLVRPEPVGANASKAIGEPDTKNSAR
jgi:hypothetical protein